MMKKFLDFIKQGWFLSLLGVIILSVILYFVAPLVFSESTALIATIAGIALLVIGWMGFQLLGIILSRRKNEQVLDSLQEMDDHHASPYTHLTPSLARQPSESQEYNPVHA